MKNMYKDIKSLNLPVAFIKEAEQYVAYTPALDLSTSGRTLKEAKDNFAEAVEIFFDELISSGNFKEVLLDLGWKRQDHDMIPPVIVFQGMESVKVPFAQV